MMMGGVSLRVVGVDKTIGEKVSEREESGETAGREDKASSVCDMAGTEGGSGDEETDRRDEDLTGIGPG
jgi:hypothetical protein